MQSDNTGARGRETAPERKLPDDSPAYALAERCAWHLLEKKLEDVVVLDLRGSSDVCDFFVIASGGAGTLGHFAAAVTEGHADAVLAASVFHDGVYSIEEVKRAMADSGVAVRL